MWHRLLKLPHSVKVAHFTIFFLFPIEIFPPDVLLEGWWQRPNLNTDDWDFYDRFEIKVTFLIYRYLKFMRNFRFRHWFFRLNEAKLLRNRFLFDVKFLKD